MESQQGPHLIGYKKVVEGGPSPSRLQNSVSERTQVSERIVPKLQAQIKERWSCTYRIISGTFYPTYTTSHLDI